MRRRMKNANTILTMASTIQSNGFFKPKRSPLSLDSTDIPVPLGLVVED
jgi:hypothetical protein